MSSEVKTSGGAGQGPTTLTQQLNFVENLFGKMADQAWIGCSGGMFGQPYTKQHLFDLPANQSHYFCCAALRPNATARDLLNFEFAMVVVLDDVMSLMAVGNPKQIPKAHVDKHLPITKGCYIIETSKGNFQYGWGIWPEDLDRWRYFQAMMKLHPVYGASARQGDAVHYYRLPSGVNYKNGFQTRLVQDYDRFRWELDDLAKHFGIDMSKAAVDTWLAGSGKTMVATSEQASHDVLRQIMEMIPNDAFFDDRLEWAKIGFALKNASNDDPETRELWIDWDRPDGLVADAERFWDTANDPRAGLSTLFKELERRHGKDSPQRKKAADLHAPEVFGVIDDADVTLPKPAAETQQEKEIDQLLAEIAKHRPTPKKHQENNDPSKLVSVFDLMKQVQVEPPVVFHPYTRGKVMIEAGPPSIGKSTLLEQQCLTVVAERPDLLRHGGEKIRFPGDIVYFCNEDGEKVFTQRAKAWSQHFNVDTSKAKHHVYPVVSNLMTRESKGTVFDCIGVLRAVLDKLKAGRDVTMIVVDTMPSSVLGFEENSASEMAFVTAFLNRLARAFWAAVVFIHHGTKATWDGNDWSLAGIRGTGGLTGFARGAVLVLPPSTEYAKQLPGALVAAGNIAVEVIAKASDGRQGYVACTYERIEVSVVVEDAETDGLMTSRMVPVMVPLVAKVKAFDDEMELERLRGVLDDALGRREEVRLYASNRSSDMAAIHIRWDMDAKDAADIFAKMSQRGWFKSTVVTDRHSKTTYGKVTT